MSWASEAVGAIRKIILVEDRIERVANHVDQLAETCRDLDRRLVRLEAKFDLIEKIAAPGRRALPAKAQSHRDKKKTS
jgi:hypothetical protein